MKAKGGSLPTLPILIDQGTADNFLASQVLTTPFEGACKKAGYGSCEIRMQEGYDHRRAGLPPGLQNLV